VSDRRAAVMIFAVRKMIGSTIGRAVPSAGRREFPSDGILSRRERTFQQLCKRARRTRCCRRLISTGLGASLALFCGSS
jgi:hypothetical protein